MQVPETQVPLEKGSNCSKGLTGRGWSLKRWWQWWWWRSQWQPQSREPASVPRLIWVRSCAEDSSCTVLTFTATMRGRCCHKTHFKDGESDERGPEVKVSWLESQQEPGPIWLYNFTFLWMFNCLSTKKNLTVEISGNRVCWLLTFSGKYMCNQF